MHREARTSGVRRAGRAGLSSARGAPAGGLRPVRMHGGRGQPVLRAMGRDRESFAPGRDLFRACPACSAPAAPTAGTSSSVPAWSARRSAWPTRPCGADRGPAGRPIPIHRPRRPLRRPARGCASHHLIPGHAPRGRHHLVARRGRPWRPHGRTRTPGPPVFRSSALRTLRRAAPGASESPPQPRGSSWPGWRWPPSPRRRRPRRRSRRPRCRASPRLPAHRHPALRSPRPLRASARPCPCRKPLGPTSRPTAHPRRAPGWTGPPGDAAPGRRPDPRRGNPPLTASPTPRPTSGPSLPPTAEPDGLRRTRRPDRPPATADAPADRDPDADAIGGPDADAGADARTDAAADATPDPTPTPEPPTPEPTPDPTDTPPP